MIEKPIITISGTTASGKTSFSIAIAKEINKLRPDTACIVNFDSLLFYKEISIGTAKPTIEERDGIEHRMIDIASISEPQNASLYIERVQQEIEDLHRNNRIPILVGGSGFYLRALFKGMYEAGTPSEEIKNKVEKLYKEEGITPFLKELEKVDPVSFEELHENDHYRVTRAVEFYWMTGTPISKERERQDSNSPYDFSKNLAVDWNAFHTYLDLDKETHYNIIVKRASEMIDLGLVDEVKDLLAKGFTGNEKPLQSIGYKETVNFLNGSFDSQEEYLERIAISTRQLAKSQRTWFKKVTPKNEYNPLTDKQQFIEDCINFLNI